MVSVLASSDYNIGTCYFSASHEALRRQEQRLVSQYRTNSTLFDFKGSFNLFFKPVVSGRLGDFIIVRL
jgi:hypothetical protein